MDTKNNLPEKVKPQKKQKPITKTKVKYKGVRFYNFFSSLIALIIIVCFVLFFVVNAQYKTSLYLIFYKFQNISVSTVMLLSFLAGNIFFLFLTFRQIHKKKRQVKQQQKKEKAKEKEKAKQK